MNLNAYFIIRLEMKGVVKREYHQNGDLAKQYSELNGKLHGQYGRWFNNGQLEISGWYSNGKRVGEWKEYYQTENDDLVLREHYFCDDNEREGKSLSYYYDGTLHIECYYSRGSLDGEYKCYYHPSLLPVRFKQDQDQKQYLELHCFWKRNLLHGKYMAYRLDNQLCLECYYVDGKKNGEYKNWDIFRELTSNMTKRILIEHCIYKDDERLDIY